VAGLASPPTRSPWTQAFERHAGPAAPGTLPWLDALRRDAFERFAATGFPTTRHEDWVFTSLAPLERVSFAPPPLAAASTGCAALDPLVRALPRAVRFLLVDGRPAADAARQALPPGLSVRTLGEALRADPEGLRPHLEAAAAEDHAFALLNTAFLGQGLVIDVAPGAKVEAPVLLQHVSTRDVGPLATHLRVFVRAGAGSALRLVESCMGLGATPGFTNVLAHVDAAPGAAVQHLRVQREGPAAFHVSLLRARLAADARLTALTLSFGAALARLETAVRLEGAGSSCTLDGLFVVDGKRHADLVTRIDHLVPNASSRQLVKGVLDGESHGAFTGRVRVAPGADGTDARQACHTLLLAPQAIVDTRPQLEIYADDVKCSHGATTGRLDEAALFYLRSRALGPVEARDLLIHAFAGEVLARLGADPARGALDAMLASVLHEARSPGRAP
jgi:Fe-S cluster assembly protein SufD